jgi:hypothetical protein
VGASWSCGEAAEGSRRRLWRTRFDSITGKTRGD